MPIVYLNQQSDKFCVAVWQVLESLDQMLALHKLSAEEQNTFNTIKKDERRLQWLSSRYLLEQLFPGAILRYNPHGKPFLLNGPSISISHTTGFVAVALGTSTVGVDIQVANDKLLKIGPKFSAESDLYLFPSMAPREKLLYIWTIKEAVFKTYGNNLPFKDGIRLTALAEDFSECKVRVVHSGATAEHLVKLVPVQDSLLAYLAK